MLNVSLSVEAPGYNPQGEVANSYSVLIEEMVDEFLGLGEVVGRQAMEEAMGKDRNVGNQNPKNHRGTYIRKSPDPRCWVNVEQGT